MRTATIEKLNTTKEIHPEWSPAQCWTVNSTDITSVLKALVNHNGDFVDDHNGGSDKNIHDNGFDGVVLLIMGNGYSAICPRGAADYFCLNPMYVGEDGKAHLNTCSVGGTVMGNIDRFNKEYSKEGLKERGCTWLISQNITLLNI